MLLFKSLTLSHGIRKCCPSAFMELTPKSAKIYQNSSFLVDNFEEGNIRSKSLCAVIKMSQRGRLFYLFCSMSLFSSISSCTERNRLGTNRHFDYCRNYFQVRKNSLSLQSWKRYLFWWFWFNFWSQIIQQYLWLWPKTDRNILPQCADLIDSMIWSTIEVKFSQAGVERSNESVSDAKNSCSTPAWSKNLSTYCPLSHLMPRSFPWARNPITLVNSRKGRG